MIAAGEGPGPEVCARVELRTSPGRSERSRATIASPRRREEHVESAISVTVYGFYGSLCTQKVYLALAEKGVDAERRTVNIGPPMENYEPWYARINPRMVIPTLEHDGAFICDSAAILRYIDATFEGPRLLPQAAEARAEVEAIVAEIDGLQIRELSYKGMRGPLALARDRLLMPMRTRALRKHRAAAPELAPLYDARLEDVATWVGTMASEASIAEARSALSSCLDGLEARLNGSSSYVVGDAYSYADLMATVLCARLLALGIADLSAYPELHDHYRRMKARPNFPKEDIVEFIDRRRLVRIIAPFVLPRLLTALLLVTALLVLLRLLLR